MPLPRILRLQDDKWNNPEESIGTFIGYLRGGRYRCWEAAGPARQAFRELSSDIKDFLETSSIPPTDIVSWSIYMIGHSEKSAAPKLLICSTDSKTRKNIRHLIKDSKIMDKYPGIGLGDVSALPDRPVIRELSREDIEALLPLGCDIDGAVLADAPEPAVGKRIFVVNPHDFSLRPATTGPIIFYGDKCYQLTVAHAFRHTRELDHSFGQQTAEDDCDFDGMSDAGIDEESQYDEMTSKGSATPGEVDFDKASFEASLDAFFGKKHSSSGSQSSSSDHLDSGNNPRLSVETTEDNPDYGEFDVSRLQFFGRLVLSSLTASIPSLDYALIETSKMPETAEKSSIITGSPVLSLVSSIGEIESDDMSILATASPHCLVEGRLTATPSYIRLSEQLTFQQVYPVRLGKPLHDGDCGTAVFGKDDNRFYGHIVAGGPGTSIAYLVPAGEIYRDIQARLGFGLIWMPQQEGQQFSRSRTSTDASSVSDKLPKRQNSNSIGDIEHGLPKRLRIIHRSPALPHAFPASVIPATGLSLEASVDATREAQRWTRDIPPSPSDSDPSSSSVQRDEIAGSLARRSVLPQDFDGAYKICIFWLLSPEHFSSTEWQICRNRKESISHIISHVIDHHGLIRGHDPQNPARRYLASCQSSNPFVKANGDCAKCSSLDEWNDGDFADLTHHGIVLCLRCWRKFDKKEMKEHMAGPLCDSNMDKPRAQKLWSLYTAFCSETQLPRKPRNMPPRKSHYLPSPLFIRNRPQRVGQARARARKAASVDNLDTKISPPDTKPLLPRLQPGSSLLPSAAEESTEPFHSPKLDASMRLWDEANDLDVDMSPWDYIGSNPNIQTTIDAADPPSLQLTERHQELEPKGETSPYQMAAMEKDSGYRSADGKDM